MLRDLYAALLEPRKQRALLLDSFYKLETEVLRGWATCLWSHRKQVGNAWCESLSSDSGDFWKKNNNLCSVFEAKKQNIAILLLTIAPLGGLELKILWKSYFNWQSQEHCCSMPSFPFTKQRSLITGRIASPSKPGPDCLGTFVTLLGPSSLCIVPVSVPISLNFTA